MVWLVLLLPKRRPVHFGFLVQELLVSLLEFVPWRCQIFTAAWEDAKKSRIHLRGERECVRGLFERWTDVRNICVLHIWCTCTFTSDCVLRIINNSRTGSGKFCGLCSMYIVVGHSVTHLFNPSLVRYLLIKGRSLHGQKLHVRTNPHTSKFVGGIKTQVFTWIFQFIIIFFFLLFFSLFYYFFLHSYLAKKRARVCFPNRKGGLMMKKKKELSNKK